MTTQLDIFGNNFDELHKKVAHADIANLSDAEKQEFYKGLALEMAAKAFNSLTPKSTTWDIKRVMDTISESLKTIKLAEEVIKIDDDTPDVVTVVRRSE